MLNMGLKIINSRLQPHLPGVNELTHWGRVKHIQENPFQNVVCEMAAILSRPECVNATGVTAEGHTYYDWCTPWWDAQKYPHPLYPSDGAGEERQ